MKEDVDLQGVCDQLQHENERLRMMLLTIRNNNPSMFDLHEVWGRIKENSMQIYMFVLVSWVIISFAETFIGLFKKGSKTNA